MAEGQARDNNSLPLTLLLRATSAQTKGALKCRGKMPSLLRGGLPGSFNLPKELRLSPLQFSTTPIGRDKLKTEGESMS